MIVMICLMARPSAMAQELPSPEEESDMRKLQFELFESRDDSTRLSSMLERVVTFRNKYPESLYNDQLLQYEVDIRAALGADCSELRPPVQELLASDSYPLEAIQLAAKLSRFDCFDIVVADMLATLDPPIENRRADDIVQYHQLRADVEQRRGDELASAATLLDGLHMLSAKAPRQCTARISQYLERAVTVLDIDLAQSFPALAGVCE